MSAAPYPWQAVPWQALVKSLDEGRFGHGVLLCGPVGVGKRTFAEALAQRLLCESQSGCGECPPCHWYAAGNHPDWHVLQPEEDKTTIPVDGVRALTAQLALSSLAGGRKVALIEPADAMTVAAANSLLKTLEEPPGSTALLLLASRPSRLPATILSRCQVHAIAPPPAADAAAWLRDHGDENWPGLLHLAGGAPLAALALAEAGFGTELKALPRDVAGLLAGSADPAAVAARWQKLGPETALAWLERFVGDAIRWRFGLGDGDPAHRFVSKGLPPPLNEITLNRMFEYLDAVQTARRQLDGPVTAALVIETLLIPLAAGLTESEVEALTL